MSHIGIKNVAGKKIKQKYGGIQYDFDKDEVKIVPADAAQFFASVKTFASDGKLLTQQALFKAVPLIEALKVAKEPENPEIAKAKAQIAQEEKHTGEIAAAVRKALIAEGWTAPAAKK